MFNLRVVLVFLLSIFASGFNIGSSYAYREQTRSIPARQTLVAAPTRRDPRLPPLTQNIVNGIIQPAQTSYEPRHRCRLAGIDRRAVDYYSSLSHLTCTQAKRLVRSTHFGANINLGKYYKCDNRQAPALAFWLATDEELANHREPEAAECPYNWLLHELHVQVADGDCFIGFDCFAKTGGN